MCNLPNRFQHFVFFVGRQSTGENGGKDLFIDEPKKNITREFLFVSQNKHLLEVDIVKSPGD